MAATLSYQTLVTSGTGASSYTLSFTAASAAGQERLLAISGISNGNTTTIAFSSVTIDGQSATAVGSHVRAADGSGNGPVIAFFRAPGTSATTFNVAYSCSNAMFDARCFLWNLSGAGTLLASGTAFENSNVAAALDLSLNTVADGAIAAAMLAYANVTPKTENWTGLTERSDSMGFYGNDWQSAADLNAGSASTPLTVTAAPSATWFGGSGQVGLAVSFNPATGGGGGGQQIIDIGSAIDDGTGDPARVAFDKCNDNFTELYTADAAFLTTTVAATTYAPLASPTFTGDPQAPTPASTDNDTSIATTAFVKAAIAAAGQVFYCDLTDAANVATYKRMLLTPSAHAESSASVVCTGTTTDFLIASFITDPGVPGAIDFPAGSAYRRLYGSVSGGAARFRMQVYTRTVGGVETLARDETSNNFSDTVATLQEWLATPATGGTLAATDRLVVKVSARRISGPTNVTVTLYSEGSAHASQIQTTIALNASTVVSATPPLALSGGNISIDLSGHQPLDATLTALAAYNTNGLLTQTAADTFTGRSIAVPAAGISITNANGVSGNPTLALADDLAALEALTGTNTIYYRSGTSAWSAVTVSTGLSFTGGALTCTVTAGGNVSNSGTPTSGQFAKWVTATTVQGVAAATVLSDIGAQALDADLTSLAGASGTNTIYYRSAANTWSPVVVSTGLAFSGGNLTATGGNVSNSGTPTAGQVAEWVTATTIAGVSTYAKLASPIFSGTPSLPTGTTGITQTVGNSSTALATTAFVQTAAAVIGSIPQGRLTLQTATPVMTTTQAAKTTIYYTPYAGCQVPIYDGTNMTMTTFAELSVAITDTTKSPAAIGASKVNDWFIWSDAGTIRIGHGPDWSSDTARSAGTALVRVGGTWLNNASITNGPAASRGTYVGTTRSNASSQLDWILGSSAVGGGQAFLWVWNCYNRRIVTTAVVNSTSSWTYNGAVRNAAGSATFRANWLDGLGESFVTSDYGTRIDTSSNQQGLIYTTPGTGTAFSRVGNYNPTGISGGTTIARSDILPALGVNYVQAQEYGSAATITFYGAAWGSLTLTLEM